ncbi:dedicator of cytokinesis-domain-containing protein [Hyaloraphidium curvatum]|nr:dedicator of cytokinesis-domain-containing protein [Hyaloraphidium curvatum]
MRAVAIFPFDGGTYGGLGDVIYASLEVGDVVEFSEGGDQGHGRGEWVWVTHDAARIQGAAGFVPLSFLRPMRPKFEHGPFLPIVRPSSSSDTLVPKPRTAPLWDAVPGILRTWSAALKEMLVRGDLVSFRNLHSRFTTLFDAWHAAAVGGAEEDADLVLDTIDEGNSLCLFQVLRSRGGIVAPGIVLSDSDVGVDALFRLHSKLDNQLTEAPPPLGIAQRTEVDSKRLLGSQDHLFIDIRARLRPAAGEAVEVSLCVLDRSRAALVSDWFRFVLESTGDGVPVRERTERVLFPCLQRSSAEDCVVLCRIAKLSRYTGGDVAPPDTNSLAGDLARMLSTTRQKDKAVRHVRVLSGFALLGLKRVADSSLGAPSKAFFLNVMPTVENSSVSVKSILGNADTVGSASDNSEQLVLVSKWIAGDLSSSEPSVPKVLPCLHGPAYLPKDPQNSIFIYMLGLHGAGRNAFEVTVEARTVDGRTVPGAIRAGLGTSEAGQRSLLQTGSLPPQLNDVFRVDIPIHLVKRARGFRLQSLDLGAITARDGKETLQAAEDLAAARLAELSDAVDPPGELPAAVRSYYRSNEVRWFSLSRPFRRTFMPAGGSGNDDVLQLWIEKTVLITKDALPGCLPFSEVVSTRSREYNPIENAVIAMRAKNRELDDLQTSFSACAVDDRFSAGASSRQSVVSTSTQMSGGSGRTLPSSTAPPNLDRLTSTLHGVILSPVNGGVSVYTRFFSREVAEMHQDQAVNLEMLSRLMKDQHGLVRDCLELHGKLVPPPMVPLHNSMVSAFRNMVLPEPVPISP